MSISKEKKGFDKFLYTDIDAYRTFPDDGNRHICITSKFLIADEMINNLEINDLKMIIVDNLEKIKINLIEEIDEKIKTIRGYEQP